ncbi:hypothetical protein AB2B41_22925, partial [Marimonas sp. MJW-29]
MDEFNGRFRETVLRRRVWLRNLIVARMEVSLHQHQAGKSAQQNLVLCAANGWNEPIGAIVFLLEKTAFVIWQSFSTVL